VIKKFDFPALQPLTEAQHENRILDMVHQAVGQAFVSHAPIMANCIHNDVVKTLHEGGLQGYRGPAYQQASHMVFAPTGSATTMPPIVPQSHAEGSIRVSQPTGSTVPPHFSPVFTNSTPMTTSVLGGFMLGYPVRWDPAIGLGMPPEFFIPSTVGQASSSASQPATEQTNASASQPI